MRLPYSKYLLPWALISFYLVILLLLELFPGPFFAIDRFLTETVAFVFGWLVVIALMIGSLFLAGCGLHAVLARRLPDAMTPGPLASIGYFLFGALFFYNFFWPLL